MTTQTLSNFANFLKILFVENTVTEGLSDNVALYGTMRRRGQIRKFEGRSIRYPIQNQRQYGTSWTAEDGTLPTATASTAIEPEYTAFNNYAVGDITDQVIEDAMTTRGAYERALPKVRDDLLLSQKQVINAAYYGDGTCALNVLPAPSNANPILTDQPITVFQGQIVDLIDQTDNSTRILDGRSVTSVNHLTNAIAYSGADAAGTAAGDYFVPQGTVGLAGEQYATWGLLAGTDSANPPLSNLGGIDRTVLGNEVMQGNKFGSPSTILPVSEAQIQDDLEVIRRRSNFRLKDLCIWTNHKIVQQYFADLVNDRQFNVETSQTFALNGGFDSGAKESGEPVGKFAGTIDIYADENSPRNTIFYLNLPDWRIYETHAPELIDRDGSVLHRYIDRGAYQFRSLYRCAFFPKTPSASGRRDGVAQ